MVMSKSISPSHATNNSKSKFVVLTLNSDVSKITNRLIRDLALEKDEVRNDCRFEIKGYFPQDEIRGRQSIIVEDYHDKHYIYCRGGFQSMLATLTSSDEEWKELFINQATDFERQGLKVQIFCYKELDETDYEKFITI
jgi:magnesium-transporting ATPase (P-type)